jgi:hypothetical protein
MAEIPLPFTGLLGKNMTKVLFFIFYLPRPCKRITLGGAFLGFHFWHLVTLNVKNVKIHPFPHTRLIWGEALEKAVGTPLFPINPRELSQKLKLRKAPSYTSKLHSSSSS